MKIYKGKEPTQKQVERSFIKEPKRTNARQIKALARITELTGMVEEYDKIP